MAEKDTESARHNLEDRNAPQHRSGFWRRAWDLYADGFRSMTIGRKLWALIAIKLVIIFLVLKIFFFPDFLASKSDTDAGKATVVRENLTKTDPTAKPHYQETYRASESPCQEANPASETPCQAANPVSELPDL